MYEILGFLLLLTYITLTNSEGISCYQCTPTSNNRNVPPCSKFDWSEQFVVSCPMSTFCLRKTFTVPLGNGGIQQIEMGCAPQTTEVRKYDHSRRKWNNPSFEIMDKAYEDGCSVGEDTGRPGGPAEYCYCSYYLCNGSDSINKFIYSVFASRMVVSIFLILGNYYGI